jgi:HK97 family phage major capsid protein
MTDELVSDAAALGGELQSMFAHELTFQVEDAIVEGTGAGQPLGYTVGALPAVDRERDEPGRGDDQHHQPVEDVGALARALAEQRGLAVNVDTQPQLDFLTIPAGAGALEPRFVNYGPDGILRIKGRPVVPVEYCATLGTSGDIALVDLSKYRLIRKGGVEQASSIHVLFTTGQQTFRAFYRCDGQPMPRAAITPFKGSNTQSPFIVLATRS